MSRFSLARGVSLFLFLFLVVLLSSCSKSSAACPADSRQCPDGTFVTRDADCNFPRCANYEAIDNFQSCLSAGYPIVNENPRTCVLPDGSVFTDAPKLEKKLKTQLIETRLGTLELSNFNNTATLKGTLSRPTPCDEWNIKALADTPPSFVLFSITNLNAGGMCIQVIGEPQYVEAKSPAMSSAKYKITLEDEVVFDGEMDNDEQQAVP